MPEKISTEWPVRCHVCVSRAQAYQAFNVFYHLAAHTTTLRTPPNLMRLFGRLRHNNKINCIKILYKAAFNPSILGPLITLNMAKRIC